MEDPTKFKSTSLESKEKIKPPCLFSDQQLSLLREHDIFKYSSKFLYALSKASEIPGQTFDLPYNPNLLSNVDIQDWENFPEKEIGGWRRDFDDDMSFFSRGEGEVMGKYIQLYKEHPEEAMDLQNQVEVKSPLGHRGSSMFRTMNRTPFGGYLKTYGIGESLFLSSLNQANNLRDGVMRFFIL